MGKGELVKDLELFVDRHAPAIAGATLLAIFSTLAGLRVEQSKEDDRAYVLQAELRQELLGVAGMEGVPILDLLADPGYRDQIVAAMSLLPDWRKDELMRQLIFEDSRDEFVLCIADHFDRFLTGLVECSPDFAQGMKGDLLTCLPSDLAYVLDAAIKSYGNDVMLVLESRGWTRDEIPLLLKNAGLDDDMLDLVAVFLILEFTGVTNFFQF